MNDISDGNQQIVLQKQVSSHNKRKSIICKFWITGTCNKEEKCEYTHSMAESFYYNQSISINSQTKVCPYYKLGFCKNGNYCNYIHIISSESEINNSVPIWYLEYLYEKPINHIFDEFEICNPEETKDIKEKIMNNHLNVKFKFNYNANNHNQIKTFKHFHDKNKDYIMKIIESKARYFYCKVSNSDLIHKLHKKDFLPTNRHNQIIYKESMKSCENVILIVFDCQKKIISGFCKLIDDSNDIKEIKDDEKTYKNFKEIEYLLEQDKYSRLFRTEWLWSTKLSVSKVSNLVNPLNNNCFLVNSKDGQELSIDLGVYICKLMMNLLSDLEMQSFESKNNSLILGNNANQSPDYDCIKNTNVSCKGSSSTIVLDNSIKNIIYEEISNKSNLNSGSNQRKKLQNPIIFTNISNLQVNITPEIKKEISKDDDSGNGSKGNDSKKNKKRKKDKKRKRSSPKEQLCDESYHSDETVILKKFEKRDEIKKGKSILLSETKLNRKRSRSSSSISLDQIDKKDDEIQRKSNNNSFNSKLFSKAMENVAISFMKKNNRNYNNSNKKS